ncbi:MAG: biotin--[acetyl-CoA-carboxylase] ligase [Armatimonadetes bacterium]|nr:biotin--[acetyl-CoA-carboxylase] ligase [Armatimonadota bacterium]
MNHAEIPWRLHRFASLPSTNDVALAAIEQGTGAVGDVYLATQQTAGRGRRGRRWVAGPGALLLSAILPTQQPAEGASLAAGIAVAEAIRALGFPARLKWPNDVYLAGRKLGGILVESRGRGNLIVVGIGLNVNNVVQGAPEAPNAISLAEAGGRPVDGEALRQRVLAELGRVWPVWVASGFAPLRPRWNALDAACGRWVRVGESLEGLAVGVDESGALLVRLPSGEIRCARAGEVTYV